MKKSLICLLIFVFILFLFPTINAATINANSCSLEDVQKAIDAAEPGDVVRVPAGNCVWGTGRRTIDSGFYVYPSLAINKSLALIGEGINKTNITCTHNQSAIIYKPANFSANDPFRISGFTFDFDDQCTGIRLSYSYTDLTIQTKIRIDHNHFKDSASQALTINGYRGVADHNIFTGTDYPIRFASGDDHDWWQNWEGIVFGKADNNFYFEDNIIEAYDAMVDCQYGNRYAFRYNTIRALGPASYPLMDMHGDVGTESGGCAYRSCFGSEIYGNHISLNSGYADFRGGKHAIFYNYISKTGNFWGLRDSEGVSLGWEACDCVYCDTDNPQPQHISDSYSWNNRGSSLTGPISNFYSRGFADCVEKCGYIVNENDEFFNFNPSFDGTSGVGCDTLSERPGTCTFGVGYWATAQSCSDLTGFVGANHTNIISGTLYKCTSPNTWTVYYTPYIYPHPLSVAPSGTNICDEGKIISECWCEGLKSVGYCYNGYYSTEEGDRIIEPPVEQFVTIQEMLNAYQNYKRNEVSILYFLDKLRNWIVFW